MRDLEVAPVGDEETARTLRQAIPVQQDRLTVSPREAATMLGVDVSFVYTWVRNGELPHFMAGRAIKIPVEGLHEFIRRKSGLTGQATTARRINEST